MKNRVRREHWIQMFCSDRTLKNVPILFLGTFSNNENIQVHLKIFIIPIMLVRPLFYLSLFVVAQVWQRCSGSKSRMQKGCLRHVIWWAARSSTCWAKVLQRVTFVSYHIVKVCLFNRNKEVIKMVIKCSKMMLS